MTCIGCPTEGRCYYCGRTQPTKRGLPVPHDIPTNLPTTGVHKEETT